MIRRVNLMVLWASSWK